MAALYWTTQYPENNVNVVIGQKCTEKEKRMFFGESSEDQRWLFYPDTLPTLGIILRDAGFVGSRTVARKIGWDLPIQPGYSEFLYGKKPPRGIFIYMPLESYEEFILAVGASNYDENFCR